MRTLVLLALGALACTNDSAVNRDLGGACTSHGDCTNLCLPPPAWPNGFCTKSCMGEPDCPADSKCVTTPADGQACLFACNDDRDCDFLDGPADADWSCVDFSGDAGTGVRACAAL